MDKEELTKLAKEYLGVIADEISYIGDCDGIKYFLPQMKNNPAGGYGLPFLVSYHNGEFHKTSFDEFIKITSLLRSIQKN